MAYLIDTGVLLRGFDKTSSDYQAIRETVRRLSDRGEQLIVSIQNVAEFWNVMTRPIANNGFGFLPVRARRRVEIIERFCDVVSEDLTSYRTWQYLLNKFSVSGVAVHDARLVSVMMMHQIEHILTLNKRDFTRYAAEGIDVVVPEVNSGI